MQTLGAPNSSLSSGTGTLRMVKSALGYVQIEKKEDLLSDADFLAVVQRDGAGVEVDACGGEVGVDVKGLCVSCINAD